MLTPRPSARRSRSRGRRGSSEATALRCAPREPTTHKLSSRIRPGWWPPAERSRAARAAERLWATQQRLGSPRGGASPAEPSPSDRRPPGARARQLPPRRLGALAVPGGDCDGEHEVVMASLAPSAIRVVAQVAELHPRKSWSSRTSTNAGSPSARWRSPDIPRRPLRGSPGRRAPLARESGGL